MVDFNDISAKSDEFKRHKQKYSSIYPDFQTYAELLSYETGRVKKKSHKAESYVRYLNQLTILYKQNFGKEIPSESLDTFAGLAELERVFNLKGFTEFNKSRKYFYSAAFSCFRAYITNKYAELEYTMDDKLNLELQKKSSTVQYQHSPAIGNQPKKKAKKIGKGKSAVYPRNIAESLAAKINSNWTCELDKEHVTFNSPIDGNNFVEAHHLIPMAAQDNYNYSLDFSDNIVTLCPNCHRKIHHADPKTKLEALELLFKKRKKLYTQHGIKITFKTLKNYYGII